MTVCVNCGEEIVACREHDDCPIGWMHAATRSHLCRGSSSSAWTTRATTTHQLAAMVAKPAGGGEPCPRCGQPVVSKVRLRGSVYFVDRLCEACGFTDMDDVGGV